MFRPIKVIVLVGVLFAWLPARAQFLRPGFESNIELTKHDLEIIHQPVDQQVHGKPVGTTATWSNPDSGNYGSIKLLKKHHANGRQCEAVRYTLATKQMPVPPQHYVLDSCLQPDGTWKIT
jgi:surface antigen